MFNKKIGFDFGDNRVKMVAYDGTGIKKAAALEVLDHMSEEGSILSMNAMADFILEGTKEQGMRGGSASLILPANSVFTKTVSMPVMSHQQVLYNLPYEFSDYLTQEKGLYYFDYMVLGTETDEEGKPDGMRLFACAVLKSVINDYRSMFRRAGFRLKTAVPVEYAYAQVLKQYLQDHNLSSDADYCIVDIGHTETRVFIYHGCEHIQRRNIEFGMRGLDRLIAEQLNVDEHVARTYKESDYNDVLSADYCVSYYNELAVEIMKTVNFFNYNTRDADLSRIYLAGGGTAIGRIAESIRNMTGLDTVSASVFFPNEAALENGELFLAAYGSVM